MSENVVEVEALYQIEVSLFPSGEVTLAVKSVSGEPESALVVQSLEAAIRIVGKCPPVAMSNLN